MAAEVPDKPRIGIPWRTLAEETVENREKLDYYFEAVKRAGGQPVAVSLAQGSASLLRQIDELDGFVLPGSPADVEPSRYGAKPHPKTQVVDCARDNTDARILHEAFAAAKPVFAICYGCQMLNVYLGGSLIQDIRSEIPAALAHGATDLPAGARIHDLRHEARLEPGSRLANLAGGDTAVVNSSHHQSIERPGKGLRVTVQSADGIVEGVEWGGANWVTGVQWHPERMPGDALAERLFQDFLAAVRARAGTPAGR
jgi:putative glutamine amidotransferase